MNSLIPKHLLDLFTRNKKRGDVELRQYSAISEFKLTVQKLAKHRGRSEQEVLNELAQAAQEKLRNDKQMTQRWLSLTLREQEVVALVCLGVRNYQIADMLAITYGTVKSHLQNIFHKFDMRERKAIREALKDWDFEAWWMKDPHRQEIALPRNTTSE